MNEPDWKSIMAYYRKGRTADMLQAKIKGEWGAIWTVSSCSPDGLSRIGQQFTRSRAQAVRHFRRAVLTRHGAEVRRVVILTHLPSRDQQVYCVETEQSVSTPRFLCDEAQEALMEAYIPSATE